MSLPYFFIEQLTATSRSLVLNEEQSKHIIQVLRMQKGDEILLTDGKGNKAHARILDDHRKHCEVEIISVTKEDETPQNVCIAISLIKNASRFEWFLEKVTEIGVSEIIPLICERTEKEKFRHDRLHNILVSAMLQSQQCWLPILQEPVAFEKLSKENRQGLRFIAHCLPAQKQQLSSLLTPAFALQDTIILIGPEGDFTENEIQLALSNSFIPVALGNTRLRTETAGLVAATLLRNC
jgi:16S rRNA (uracil1498-N3)-methyltransferase